MNSPELRLQVVVIFQIGVLGTELRPSSRTVCALNCLGAPFKQKTHTLMCSLNQNLMTVSILKRRLGGKLNKGKKCINIMDDVSMST